MAKTSNMFLGGGPSPRRSGRVPRGGGWFSFRFFIAAVICVLIFAAGVVWHGKLEAALWSIVAPLQQFRLNVSTSEAGQLRAQLASNAARVADRDALYQENLDLKKRLGRTSAPQVILAGVVMRPPQIPYDTLIVDAGISEGVHQGDLVSGGGTTLIGTVAEVYGHSSRIVLLSAPGQTYDVILHMASSSQETVPVNMQGQGSGSFVGQVPAGTLVKIGDILLFPGIASQFVGSVSSVQADPKQSFETLYAHLPIDPLSLQFVEIQKDSYAQQ